MKKIIAVLLSIMLTFGVVTSAFAVVDATDTTSVSISEVETPSDAPATDTDVPATDTDVPATETDPSTETDVPTTSPNESEEPSFLDRIDSAILDFIKEIVKIIGDAWDALVAFLDQYN